MEMEPQIRRRDLEGMRIGVVGCGIAGLASAIFLARRGAETTLFERFEAPRPLGAGFLLQPTGMAVLAALGLYDDVRQSGARVDALTGFDWRGRRIVDLSYGDFDRRLYGLGVHRGVVFQALYAAAGEAGVRFEFGAEAIGAEQNGGVARLILRGGSSDGFDLLLIADGARSGFREALGLTRRDAPYKWACVWRIAADPGDLLAGDFGRTLDQRYDGARRMAGVLPIGAAPGNKARHAALFWSLKAQDHAEFQRGGREAWLTELRAFWPRFADFIEAAPWEEPTLAVYRDVVTRRPYSGRIVLLGDAAHAMSPQLGQGANLALLDAFALDRALIEAGPEAAPARYAAMRRSQLGWYQLASRWLTPVFQSDRALWGLGRDLLFPRLQRISLFRNEMLAGQAGMKRGLFSIDRRDWTPGLPPPQTRALAAEGRMVHAPGP